MKTVPKDRMSHHRDRAEALFRTMQLIAEDEPFVVPILAVHSAISLADAILVGLIGERANDMNHRESSEALKKLCKSRKKPADGVNHLTWLLAKKTESSYGDKRLDPNDQVKAARVHAERFASWAYITFPEIARTKTGAQR